MLCFQAPALRPCHRDLWSAASPSSPRAREIDARAVSPPHWSTLIIPPLTPYPVPAHASPGDVREGRRDGGLCPILWETRPDGKASRGLRSCVSEAAGRPTGHKQDRLDLPAPEGSRSSSPSGPRSAGRMELTLWPGLRELLQKQGWELLRCPPLRSRVWCVPADPEGTSWARPLGFPWLRLFPCSVPPAPRPLPQPFLLERGLCLLSLSLCEHSPRLTESPQLGFSARNPRHIGNIVTQF